MPDALTLFLTTGNALSDDVDEALVATFENLDADLMGIGEVVGWDDDGETVQFHVLAEEPARVIESIRATLVDLGVHSARVEASDPATGSQLYQRQL
jgi:hypothetical protein